jgi:hypothetical protein
MGMPSAYEGSRNMVLLASAADLRSGPSPHEIVYALIAQQMTQVQQGGLVIFEPAQSRRVGNRDRVV